MNWRRVIRRGRICNRLELLGKVVWQCNNMAFPAPRMNYRYLTPHVAYRGYLAQITTSLDF
jgi:hypothetical protein